MDTTFLRGQLNQRFDDVQFDAFCIDYFFEVYDLNYLAVDPAALEAILRLVWERIKAELGNKLITKRWQQVEWEEATKR